MTTTQRRAIFREKALKHYTEGRKKDILPNFNSISAPFFAWMLLASLIATGLVAWLGQVPVFLTGNGIVLGNTDEANGGANTVAFFAPAQAAQLQAGDAVQVQLSSNSVRVTGTIIRVLPGTTDLATALTSYGLNLGGSPLSSRQVTVALVKLGDSFSAANYMGSPMTLEVNVGTESLFSALTGIKFS
jgi:hypothetical protein